jgi:hypothetical protein
MSQAGPDPSAANLRELMERMGHASSRAVLFYLHSTRTGSTHSPRRSPVEHARTSMQQDRAARVWRARNW